MGISKSPWSVAQLVLLAGAAIALIIAPEAARPYGWWLLAGFVLLGWAEKAVDASLSPGDRAIERAKLVLGGSVILISLVSR